jgi:hypothetical protein
MIDRTNIDRSVGNNKFIFDLLFSIAISAAAGGVDLAEERINS